MLQLYLGQFMDIVHARRQGGLSRVLLIVQLRGLESRLTLDVPGSIGVTPCMKAEVSEHPQLWSTLSWERRGN